jgi:carbonic anhydrase
MVAGMSDLKNLIESNRSWAESKKAADPEFFERLSKQQKPGLLWIGCADSRVPANEILGLDPGEVFVHRNIANVVVHTDFNCLSVVQYAVQNLKVRDIIVCGHYGCGGVQAAMTAKGDLGLIHNWLHHIKDVYAQHDSQLEALDEAARADKLCELNVAAQVANLSYTTIVQDAWESGQELSIHGWIYGLKDGHLQTLDIRADSPEDVPAIYQL